MKTLANCLFFLFLYCNIYAQSDKFYFIGKKIKEEYRQFKPITKLEIMENGTTEEVTYRTIRCKGYYYSEYKVLKVLNGNYDSDTVRFYSTYCSEFGYRQPLDDKYIVVGLMKNEKKEWMQNYTERIYYVKNKWILPYKSTYPFIDYKNLQPQKLERFQRIKINTSNAYSETLVLADYPAPFYNYKKGRVYATAIYGFVF